MLRVVIALGLLTLKAAAVDPPHTDGDDFCSSCHLAHQAAGGVLTSVNGNANLCQSCHVPGGTASAKAFVNGDQAQPWPGLPAGTNASGTSHRWDSGAAGRVQFLGGAVSNSTGTVLSGGVFTGAYAKTFTLTITAAGNVGTARFNWMATIPGGGAGTNIVTGTNVALNEGVSATFRNGSGVSFQTNDRWNVYVRPELRSPTNSDMADRMQDGLMMCSTCHDPHSQALAPFDPAAATYSPTATNRHYMRIANDTEQMCLDCHAAWDVTNALTGSHPVGIVLTNYTNSVNYKFTTNLPLEKITGKVRCETCHQMHYAVSTDGSLLRMTNRTSLCVQCHLLADINTPAGHLSSTNNKNLWPGGQYGSFFPRITDAAKQGACVNCHQPHGWPDAASPTNHYPLLLVDREENLCFTCHDADGPATRKVAAEFSKISNHPLALASGVHAYMEPAVVNLRHVECTDCHNSHKARARVNLPGPSPTPRPASGPLAGVRGINAAGEEVNPAVYEYEVCYRCHADSTNMPASPTQRQFTNTNVRVEFGGSVTSSHPVTVRGNNPYVPSLVGGWTTNGILACTDCHNNNAGPNNGGGGPNGPHGSTNAMLLERTYAKADNTGYAQSKYALCFKCHSAISILGDISFKEHSKHIQGENTPCNVCHDPHASPGQLKLINFDTKIVRPSPSNGKLEFKSTGQYRGECSLTCHNKDHNPETYQP